MSAEPGEHSFLERFNQGFQGAAVVCLRTLILFVVLNVLIGYGYTFQQQHVESVAAAASKPEGAPKPGPNRTAFQMMVVDMNAYDGVSPAAAEEALDDTTKLGQSGYQYEPWVEVAPPPFNSKSVNIDTLDGNSEFVYRRSILDGTAGTGAPLEVYTFGGSTMFGFNAADNWTIASYLWRDLQDQTPQRAVKMTNFGRPMYYSSQEVLLFQRLLRAGKRPAVAVFLDGLNDTFQMSLETDQPMLTPTLKKIVAAEQLSQRGTGLRDYQWVPIVRLAYSIRNAHQTQMSPLPTVSQVPPPNEAADYVIQRYMANVDMARYLGQKYGVKTYFFFQPCPLVHYDQTLSRMAPNHDARQLELYKDVYDRMRNSKDVIYLGDSIDDFGKGRKVFLDDVHYNPSFSKFLAGLMAQHVHL